MCGVCGAHARMRGVASGAQLGRGGCRVAALRCACGAARRARVCGGARVEGTRLEDERREAGQRARLFRQRDDGCGRLSRHFRAQVQQLVSQPLRALRLSALRACVQAPRVTTRQAAARAGAAALARESGQGKRVRDAKGGTRGLCGGDRACERVRGRASVRSAALRPTGWRAGRPAARAGPRCGPASPSHSLRCGKTQKQRAAERASGLVPQKARRRAPPQARCAPPRGATGAQAASTRAAGGVRARRGVRGAHRACPPL